MIGFVLLVVGWVFPMLMVLRLLSPSLGLSFFSYSSSVVGLVLGVIGVAQYTKFRGGPGS